MCAHSLSHSSVHPFFLFVISCQPDTCHMEFHYNPNGSVVCDKEIQLCMIFSSLKLNAPTPMHIVGHAHVVHMYITWKHFCIFYLLLQLICFGLTCFNLGLIHHVVCGWRAWTGSKNQKVSERDSAKGPAMSSCAVIAPFSLAHAVCTNTYLKPDARTHTGHVSCMRSHFFPIILLNQDL